MAIPDLVSAAELIRARRTNLRIDRAKPVDPNLIRQLCELATWAPNHKLTQPWRFAVLSGDARARLGELTAAAQAASGETDDNRLNKTRAKYLRSPIVVACASSSAPGAVFDWRFEVDGGGSVRIGAHYVRVSHRFSVIHS